MEVALKAFGRIAEQWNLSDEEADALLGPDDDDRVIRISAILGIYRSLEEYFAPPLSRTWFGRPNTGPVFEGSRPVDSAIAGGLPQLLIIRRYVDDLLGPVPRAFDDHARHEVK
jgi:hypothetical protein